jgi:hypothetical protein
MSYNLKLNYSRFDDVQKFEMQHLGLIPEFRELLAQTILGIRNDMSSTSCTDGNTVQYTLNMSYLRGRLEALEELQQLIIQIRNESNLEIVERENG